jgi:hypothetical protein
VKPGKRVEAAADNKPHSTGIGYSMGRGALNWQTFPGFRLLEGDLFFMFDMPFDDAVVGSSKRAETPIAGAA